MKKAIFIASLLFTVVNLNAQTESFDIANFTSPSGWKREVKKDEVDFTWVNNTKTTSGNTTGQSGSSITSTFKEISFTAPRGWTQKEYSDGITLQSPVIECGNDITFMISILNFQRRSDDLIKQTKEFFSSQFDVAFTEDYKIITSTLNNGLKYCTAEGSWLYSEKRQSGCDGRVMLVELPDEVAYISL